jgi:hypothetical protein
VPRVWKSDGDKAFEKAKDQVRSLCAIYVLKERADLMSFFVL